MDVVLPKWGVSMQEGLIASWLVEEGEAVSEGQAIAEIETDKVAAELESPVDGILTRRLLEAGSTAKVGDVVAIVDETGR